MNPASRPWVDGLTLADVLADAVKRFGARDALVFPQLASRFTYSALHDAVRQTARAFMALGIQPGENVGIWSTNLPQWILAQFATAQIGAVLVNINPAYRAQELEYVLKQADITTLLLTHSHKSSSFFDLLAAICPEIASCSPDHLGSTTCPKLRHVISIHETKLPGMLNWHEFQERAASVSDAQLSERHGRTGTEDIVNIQFTSGTTGFPKGAMLTHRNLLMNAFHVGRCVAYTEQDRVCIPVPLYHCFGCVMGSLACVVYGAAMVFPAESFDPLATLQALQDECCTSVYGVPTMFIAQLNHPRFSEFNLRRLRTGIMAGSPCPIEVMRAVVDKMGAREMTIAYGLTECSPVITQTATTDTLEHRVRTIGKALPGLEVRIVEPATLTPVDPGRSGELIVRGHCVMRGYYKKPAETAAAITADGWLHTGDLASQTDDGFYRITGRLKDVIIRGGENIYPRELEELLYAHALVADVQVVGLPDEKFGEEVCAWVRRKPGSSLTEEEIRSFCRERLARFKVPRYVAFVEEYPTTVTGKVQKFKLRELGIARFGLQKAAAIETA